MTFKQKLFAGYFVIGLLFAIYESQWGSGEYKSFAFNLGKGIVWPVVMFPEFGAIVTGIIWMVIIGGVLFFANNKSE